MSRIKRFLRTGFLYLERGCDRLFSPAFNPFSQLGALGFFFFWIVTVSGVYLFAFFDTGIEAAYQSVEWITSSAWFHAGVMRSFHRYASEVMLLVVGLHVLREFSLDRYRGTRWFSWMSGIPLIAFIYVAGITGYWLVWDQLAQHVAIVSARLLDVLPIFGQPIARNFLTPESLSSRFFTLLVFLHIAVPLMLLAAMWIHIRRVSRPNVNPPRLLAALILAALLAVAVIRPAVSQGPANLSTIPAEVGLDWWFLPIYGLPDSVPGLAILAGLAAFFVMVAALPWLPPFRRPKAAEVDLAHCNGCNRCVEDCPYEAIQLVPRTDTLPFPQQAAVNPDLCVSCGICMGSCPSSTPFRRTEELRTGIDLPDLPLRALREQTLKVSGRLTGKSRILILACDHGAAAHRTRDAVVMPCVAMSPPSLIDYILSKDLADGVAVMGCAENACYNRLGIRWTKERFAGERDPYLRARVPRERLIEIWASPLEVVRAEAELTRFAERLQGLPPVERKSLRSKELAEVVETGVAG